MSEATESRTERDSMGSMQVPAGALYGAQTMRAALNFPISDLRLPRAFIRALGTIKLASAEVNRNLGLLDDRTAKAIVEAAAEVAEGQHDRDFVVDVFQTGSGTSTNMNANEVIANRASQLLGGELGSKLVHPNDHVNLGQSSNDVIPTAIHLAALSEIKAELEPSLSLLQDSLMDKAAEFSGVVKTGRTHLQDATPITLGQEFLGFAGQVERAGRRLAFAREQLAEVALGGTAVGTGIDTHPDFAFMVCKRISELAGVEIAETDNHFQAQATLDAVVFASGCLRTIAVSLYKIANDIRWFASGPRAGLGEMALPEVQPGSSIMPGKVNPVIVESLTMVTAQVVGNDTTIQLAGQLGSIFELNLMLPVAAYNLLQSIALLSSSSRNFAQRCVLGIEATERGPQMLEQGLMLATALTPEIGYDRAAAIAKQARASGRSIREVAAEMTDLTQGQLTQLLDPLGMTRPGRPAAKADG